MRYGVEVHVPSESAEATARENVSEIAAFCDTMPVGRSDVTRSDCVSKNEHESDKKSGRRIAKRWSFMSRLSVDGSEGMFDINTHGGALTVVVETGDRVSSGCESDEHFAAGRLRRNEFPVDIPMVLPD